MRLIVSRLRIVFALLTFNSYLYSFVYSYETDTTFNIYIADLSLLCQGTK